MNRADSLARWRRIASGSLEGEAADAIGAGLHEWIRGVAAALVAADDSDAAARPDAIVRAAGLTGALDTGAGLRDRLDTLLDFPLLDDEGNERGPLRGEAMRGLIAAARIHSPEWDHLSDDEVRKRIGRMFARK